ncbi:hypothetical protein BDBG_06450 [Blastomyces gilchristii SLH14081]|uniref:Uncharacterized protein n=3 Tax=Blastomyces TaxID=229219 RepID=A0A179UW53_BLAGS|nr:uncharacterized protein BDBG_06450 [Blastomyces gilchristii SLH14081]OAT10632.1 hypothetical protein BDBG_06450 [Blastomyces gilchristii SLH14081]
MGKARKGKKRLHTVVSNEGNPNDKMRYSKGRLGGNIIHQTEWEYQLRCCQMDQNADIIGVSLESSSSILNTGPGGSNDIASYRFQSAVKQQWCFDFVLPGGRGQAEHA